MPVQNATAWFGDFRDLHFEQAFFIPQKEVATYEQSSNR